MEGLPTKLGDTYHKSALVSPLAADPGKADPGPPILNNPLIRPVDKDGYLDDPCKPGGKKGK